jgi:hypothetical protein
MSSFPETRLSARLVILAVATVLGACASYEPQPLPLDTDLQGVQTETINDVTVSVAILTDEQAAQHFGVDFARNGLQALWLRVHNASPRQFWFIRNTVDPDFYSPDEAAVLAKDSLSGDHFEALRQHLRDESIRVQHRPMTITEGFLARSTSCASVSPYRCRTACSITRSWTPFTPTAMWSYPTSTTPRRCACTSRNSPVVQWTTTARNSAIR